MIPNIEVVIYIAIDTLWQAQSLYDKRKKLRWDATSSIGRVSVLFSWARHFTITKPPFMQEMTELLGNPDNIFLKRGRVKV